jgi:hypothetical protein
MKLVQIDLTINASSIEMCFFSETTSQPADDSGMPFLLALWKDVMSVHFAKR